MKIECAKCHKLRPRSQLKKGGICANCFARKRGLRIRRDLIKSKGDKCAKCEKPAKDRYRSLEFHHRDPSIKTFKLTVQNCGRYSMKKLQAETNKCDVLCHTCHVNEHGNQYMLRIKCW